MKYVCSICGYVYDEVEQGVPFESLPDDWTCPWCGAAKSDFEPQLEPAVSSPSAASVSPSSTSSMQGASALQVTSSLHGAAAADDSSASFSEAGDHLQNLSAGQLAALCSNLARGCEKQYKSEESRLFTQLADYFTSITPAVEDATVLSVYNALKEEQEAYPALKATAEAAGDRGAQRVCVWGEKVTRILASLVGRYLKDGDEMLEGSEVWICTVCGFVYVGASAPELCPVCKVPAWKFEKITGR